MPPLSRDAIFAVLSGLTLFGCDKAATVTAEPASSAAVAAPSAAPAATPAPVNGAAAAALVSATVTAKEVPSAPGKAAEKEKSCAPGGCAAGQCGAKK